MKSSTLKRGNIPDQNTGPTPKKSSTNSSQGSMDDVFDKDIRPYIDIIDAMRKYGLQQDIPLPNVVVVGDQSSGKSSLIEVISGIQLPRGAGIITRCPLELQLKKVPNQPWTSTVTYKSKSGGINKVVTSCPDEVESLIAKAQDDLCTTKRGVSKELITLRVESSANNAPDLTLIDLPGISRTATDDQPKDICQQIRDIIMESIGSENTVILCVISGNLDLEVNEAINIAMEVDKEGKRTIGVITKPDIADTDHKNEIIKMLENNKKKLTKGYNLVKCRSSEQLKNKLPLSEFMVNEMDFYEHDEVFRHAKKSQLGALNLAKKITVELVNVIKSTLPKLRLEIDTMLQQSKEALEQLPQGVPQDDKDKRSYMMHTANDLNEKIRSFLGDGELKDCNNFFQVWRSQFEGFQKALESKRNDALKKKFAVDKVREAITNFRGKEMSGFLSFSLFARFMKPYILSYKSNAIDVMTGVGKIVKSHLEQLFENSYFYLPYINRDMKRILNEEFDKATKATEERLDFIFKQEQIIFTMDSVFDKKWKKDDDTKKSATLNFSNATKDATRYETVTSPDQMLKHIKCYLKIVHTRLIDNVPTAVMQCLLIQLQEDLKNRICEYLSSDEVMEKVQENETISEERKNLLDKIERLKRGKTKLQSI